MAFRIDESFISGRSHGTRDRRVGFLKLIVWLAAIILPWAAIGEIIAHFSW
jgi:hypothetical protein